MIEANGHGQCPVCASMGMCNSWSNSQGKVKFLMRLARQEWSQNDIVTGDALVCMHSKYGAA